VAEAAHTEGHQEAQGCGGRVGQIGLEMTDRRDDGGEWFFKVLLVLFILLSATTFGKIRERLERIEKKLEMKVDR
jgi:hypothetical protein